MINNAVEEANIISEYGSMENYYQTMKEYAEALELEQQRIEAEANEYYDSIMES